jgi:hypothetical protein
MPPKLNFVSETPYSIVSRVFRNAVRTNNAYNTIRKHVQNWVRVKTVELKPNTNFGAFEIKIAPKYIGSLAVTDVKKVVHSCFMHALKSIPEIYSNYKFYASTKFVSAAKGELHATSRFFNKKDREHFYMDMLE